MSDTTTEYSLWLTPEEGTAAARQFRDAIADLTATHEDAVVFEPHITVVGGIDGDRTALTETTQSLAAETDPLAVTFSDVRCSTTRHQCVFQLVEPSIKLFDLHQRARDALSLPSEAYFPHLSLVYSDMIVSRRIAVAASIDTESLPEHTELSTLKLVDTTGPASTWETVISVQL
jgi:2'-5' RNA ligase